MVDPTAADQRPWLLIEASQEGILRFATAMPSPRPRLGEVIEIPIAGLPTFTDALQQFERTGGVGLRGLTAAMAIAGAPSGDAISLVRSRWTITRQGLEAVFERPVTILNDVVARAWATRAGTASVEPLRGATPLSFSRSGRYLMIMVEEGVGAAVIDVGRDGEIRILDTEAGHMDFSPASEREEILARELRGLSPTVSWERLLMAGRQDPAWTACEAAIPEPERPRLQAAMLGRFAVNLMHAFGAWQGVILTGSRVGRILHPGSRAAFDAAFGGRRNFARLVASSPLWRVDQREAVLTGTAERLAHDLQPQLQAAA